jgi:hypothetical protein
MNAGRLITTLALTLALGGAAQAQRPGQSSGAFAVFEQAGGRQQKPGGGPTAQQAAGPTALQDPAICPSFCFSVEPSTPDSEQASYFSITIYDLFTGQVIPNATFNFTWQPVANTGGHDHDDPSRPKGVFSPASGSTGASGVANIKYTAPEVSGLVLANVTCAVPSGGLCVGGLIGAFTLHGGLESLGPGTNYELVGATPQHTDNHYGTPDFNAALVKVANAYAKKFGDKVAYNDMSLIFGGLFDISGEWHPSHAEHRWGKNCDMALVPVGRRNALAQILRSNGLTYLDESDKNHWHLRK